MRLLPIVALLAALAGACQPDEPSPRERCEAEAKGECCDDDQCPGGSLCDFDYICGAVPDGVECGEPTGDRACHVACTEDQEGDACAGGGTCTSKDRFAGGDNGQAIFACF